jgi:uncharacterized membrane protein (DUF373 family)
MKIREFTKSEDAILHGLSKIFDFVVIVLSAITMAYVIYMIILLIVNSINNFNVEDVLQNIVIILIFLEILEILSMYILYHHVAIKNVVEIGVLALVKELLVTLNLKELGWEMLIGIAALVLVMGWIYIQERKRIDEFKKFLIEHGRDPSEVEE